jgi:Helix-turn-helix domain
MGTQEVAMTYTRAAVEWAMKVQEVILRALSRQYTWGAVADILGVSARTVRRVRWRYQHYGYDGLLDRRRQIASLRRVPVEELRRILSGPLPAFWWWLVTSPQPLDHGRPVSPSVNPVIS